MTIILSVLLPIIASARYVVSKKLSTSFNEYLLSVTSSLITVIILLPVFVFGSTPQLLDDFWSALVITGSINAIAAVLIFKALKIEDLSVVAPLLSLSPLFLLITSPLILGERPSLIGLVGVFIIAAGAYVLNYKGKISLKPLIEIVKNKGQRLVLFVTLLWAVSSSYYKVGMESSSPLFFIMAMNLFIVIVTLPLAFKHVNEIKNKKSFFSISLLGLIAAFTAITQWVLASLTLVVYVLSIKRLSLVLTMIGSKALFKEKNITQRLIAAAVIIIGVLLISFYG